MSEILFIAEFIASISAILSVLWLGFTKIRKIADGQKCNLRSDMLRIYYKNLPDKKIRQYEYENFVFCYEAYKALGGNSFIDKINHEVNEWTIID